MKTTHYDFKEVAARPRFVFEGNVYVCREDATVDFKCPCGCEKVVTLSLVPDAEPSWKVSGNTISPSINRIVGCKSHFSIVNGQVIPVDPV